MNYESIDSRTSADRAGDAERMHGSYYAAFAEACRKTIASGNTIYLMGNGGSACDCQHFAAELIGRFPEGTSGHGGRGSHDRHVDP